jgi:SPP1 gp7 family putative phage head morphogenesis protein
VATVNESLRDLTLIRQIELLRLSETESRTLIGLLRDADDTLADRLARFGRAKAGPTPARLTALRKDIRTIILSQTGTVREELDSYIRGVAEAEVSLADLALNRSFSTVDLTTAATPSIATAVAGIRSVPMQGVAVSQWITLLGQRDYERIWARVLQGVTIGQTTEEITRAILGTQALRNTDGIREITRRSARTLARTLTIHSSTVARNTVWEVNEDLISVLQWVSTLDGRTTAICRALDGKTYPIESGPRPPLHMSCRSAVVPVIRSAEDLGLDPGYRAAFDGRVSADTTYSEWLTGRTAAFQNEVLGPTRAKLFRDGDLEIDRFVNFNTYKPFTLQELRRREPEAFVEAGL